MKLQSGFFITLEGIEGVGKSTALKFISLYLKDKNISHVITREPGGTIFAEKIRQLLLMPQKEEFIEKDTELLLLFASRAQHLAQVILPALKLNKWVICDRFTDASYAYQGGGRGISSQRIYTLEKWLGNVQPNLTFLLDAPVKKALARTLNREYPDRIEQEKEIFFRKVRNAYLKRAKQFSARYTCIDAAQSLAAVKIALEKAIDIALMAQRDQHDALSI